MAATGRTTNYELGLYLTGDSLNYADYNASFTKVDSQMKKNEESAAANAEKIEEQNGLIGTLNDNMATVQGEVRSAKVKLEEHESNISSNSAQITSLDRRLASLTATVTDNSKDITDNVQRIQYVEREVGNTNSSINTLSATVSGISSAIDSANTSITNNANNITSLTSKVNGLDDLPNEVQEVSGEVASIKADLEGGNLRVKGKVVSVPDVRWVGGVLQIGNLKTNFLYGFRANCTLATTSDWKSATGYTVLEDGDIGFSAVNCTQITTTTAKFEGIFMAPYITNKIKFYQALNIQNIDNYEVYEICPIMQVIGGSVI